MFRIFLRLITAYQKCVSPFLGPNCRFAPSCSQYSYEAVERYGIFRGLRLTTMRLLKCHPFHPGGADPVPGSLSKISDRRKGGLV